MAGVKVRTRAFILNVVILKNVNIMYTSVKICLGGNSTDCFVMVVV